METSYTNTYEVMLGQVAALGGDASKPQTIYEAAVAVLDKLKDGVGVKIDDNNVSYTTTFSSQKITNLISVAGFKVEIVAQLPEVGDPKTIYFVPKASSTQGNVYDEYIYVNNQWEKIGSTEIDLSAYATKQWVEDKGYITASALNGYATESWVEGKGYLTQHQDLSAYATVSQLEAVELSTSYAINDLNDNKQNVISDLTTIRSGAALGYTALQSVPADYVKSYSLTYAQYQALDPKDAHTLYIITDAQ